MNHELEVKNDYYDSGNLKKEIYYKNRERDELETYWYENGKNKHTKHFIHGIENGIRKEWNEVGKKTFQGKFVDENEE